MAQEQTGPHALLAEPASTKPGSATDPPLPPHSCRPLPQLTLPGCSDNLGQSLLGQSPEGTRQVWRSKAGAWAPPQLTSGLAPRIPARPRAGQRP